MFFRQTSERVVNFSYGKELKQKNRGGQNVIGHDNHSRVDVIVGEKVKVTIGKRKDEKINIFLNEEWFLLFQHPQMSTLFYEWVRHNDEVAELCFGDTSDDVDLDKEELGHTTIAHTVKKDVRLNIGGGGEITVDVHVNERGHLLFHGMDIERFECYGCLHEKDLFEMQLIDDGE